MEDLSNKKKKTSYIEVFTKQEETIPQPIVVPTD